MKKYKKTVILDADDVLFACNVAALKVQQKKTKRKLDLYKIDRWGLLGDKIYDDRIKLFSDPDFVRSIPLFTGAKEFVANLTKKYEVVICTSVPAQVCGARLEAIREAFPQIDPGNIIFGSRKNLLSAFASLDDNPDNFKPGENVEFPVIFSQPWNMNGNTGRLRANSYEQFLSLLEALETADTEEKESRGVVLVGPSGADKNKVCAEFEKAGFVRIKSYSTRGGENYITVSPESFRTGGAGYVESSMYHGHMFGLKARDIEDVIASGKKPMLLLDINGAISVKKKYGFTTVFVGTDKETCVRNILKKDISEDEKVSRLVSLDTELGCAQLCDLVINPGNLEEEIRKIM